MFKIIFTVIILLVIFVAGASYLSYLKKGTDLIPNFSLSNDDIAMPSLPSFDALDSLKSMGDDVDLSILMQQLKGEDTTELEDGNSAAISTPLGPTYKWVENGDWHYANKPPKHINAKDLIRVD